ncbi:MAG TPA: hypothetical protein VFZ61_24275 [Polyangiales bacterium]
MDELPPKAAALLAAARRQHQPSEADEKRVRAAISAALTGSVPSSVTPELAPPGAEGASAAANSAGLLTPALSKLALLTGLLGGAAALWTSWPEPSTRHPDAGRAGVTRAPVLEVASPNTQAPQPLQPGADGASAEWEGPAPQRATSASIAAEAAAGVEVAGQRPRRARAARHSAPEAVAVTPSAVPIAEPSGEGAPRSASAASRGAHSNPILDTREEAAKGAATSEPDRIATAQPAPAQPAFGETRGSTDELALIRTALAQLNAGDAEQALALLARHAARYPEGLMAEERLGLQAISLCAAGQRQAGQEAQRSFLRQAPNSALVARVKLACPRSEP